ncbi:unnamed protein product [Phytomonas sp. EM1]|nr:unnamed protein product [Phytomonas sp. EM1]|eukprot:CCW62548.1 unnamed protein product [Phytomonas sp. isolate EM1]
MHALLNSDLTREVVRWNCFQVFSAGEGRGYIHKSILEGIQKRGRDACNGPNAKFTVSIIKALNDAFDCMAAEEEKEYLAAKAAAGKRKRRKAAVKPPVLPPHQSSVIPLSVKRRSHIDYTTFCRYFDQLPQLAAAFMHVWLPLLFTGKVGGQNYDLTLSTEENLKDGELSPATTTTTIIEGEDRVERKGVMEKKVLWSEAEDGEGGEGGSKDATIGLDVVEKLPRNATAEEGDVNDAPSDEGLVEKENSQIRETIDLPLWESGEYPLQLLGATLEIRHATLQRLIFREMDIFQKAVEHLEYQTILT